MLSKLLKYEMMSTGRIFVVCYIGVLVTALLFRLLGALAWDYGNELDTVQGFLAIPNIVAGLSMMMYVVMVVAVIVVTIIFILQRFYKNLLTGEGYLMHTLPVTAAQHIWSKLIAAVIWTILSSIVVVLSVCVLSMTGELLAAFIEEWREFLAVFRIYFGVPFSLIALECVVVLVVSIAVSILEVYLAIMLGHQAAKHKIAMAVVAYVGISVVLNIIFSIGLNLLLVSAYGLHLMDWLGRIAENMTPMQWLQVMLLGSLVLNLIMGIVFYVITERLMRRNLNLE